MSNLFLVLTLLLVTGLNAQFWWCPRGRVTCNSPGIRECRWVHGCYVCVCKNHPTCPSTSCIFDMAFHCNQSLRKDPNSPGCVRCQCIWCPFIWCPFWCRRTHNNNDCAVCEC